MGWSNTDTFTNNEVIIAKQIWKLRIKIVNNKHYVKYTAVGVNNKLNIEMTIYCNNDNNNVS